MLISFRLSAMKTRITNAKIACLDINLSKQRMHLGVHITIDDPDQLEAIRKRSVVRGPHNESLLTEHHPLQGIGDHAGANPKDSGDRRKRHLDHEGY